MSSKLSAIAKIAQLPTVLVHSDVLTSFSRTKREFHTVKRSKLADENNQP